MKKTAILVALAAVTGTTAVFPAHDKMSIQKSAYRVSLKLQTARLTHIRQIWYNYIHL